VKIPSFIRSALWLAVFLGVAWGLRAPYLHREFWNLDEGATFTMAEQILHGDVMYRDAVDHRSPLVPYINAAIFAVAGHWNIYAQHLVLALGMGCCAFGLFALCSQLGERAAGRWSAIAFTAVGLLLPGVLDALGMHTESFVIFFSTLGFWLFARALSHGGFLAGLPVGLAFAAGTLCKQPGLLDFGVTWVILGLLAWRQPVDRRRFALLFAGALAGFAALFTACCIYFWAHGAWHDFVYYCWTYNTRIYVPEVPLLQRLANIRLTWDFAFVYVPVALALGVPGVAFALFEVIRALVRRERPMPVLPLLILGWLSTGLISTMLSGRSFAHYAIQAAPGLSLACGWTLRKLALFLTKTHVRRIASGWIGAGLALWVGYSIYTFRQGLSPANPASDGDLRTLVQRYTAPTDRIFIWGYFPDGYAICRRLPATRFLYANFLTGMIPWTNVATETDTRYAVVPGAWDKFWRDYERSQPPVIIDAPIRNYTKYPLLSQPRLRDEIIDHYAELQPVGFSTHAGKIYRRLAPLEKALNPNKAPIDYAVSLRAARQEDSGLILLTAKAPAGTTDLTIRLGGKPYRHFLPSPSVPIEVRFIARLADLAVPGAGLVDVVVRTNDKVAASKPLDVLRELMLNVRSMEVTPVLAHSTRLVGPIAPEGRSQWRMTVIERLTGWHHEGPFSLTFERSPGMEVVHFAWRPSDNSPGESAAAGAAMPQLLFTRAGGSPEPIATKVTPGPGGLQQVDVSLPSAAGQFTIRWAGQESIWIGDLFTHAVGPAVHLDDRLIQPSSATQGGENPFQQNADKAWEMEIPARLIYPREPGVEGILMIYDAHRSAAAGRLPEGAGALVIEANFIHDDGHRQKLYSRSLSPTTPADQGTQAAQFALPPLGIGEIEIKFYSDGPVGLDRLRFQSARATGAGPDLVISHDRILIPMESQIITGDPVNSFTNNGWFAHAPSRLYYDCPADLRAITFGYQLPPEAYADEKGNRRSDGVGAVVEFVDRDGNVDLLYQRTIDPFRNPNDRGMIRARVELPGRAGRLVLRLTTGPKNDSSYDWSYFADHFTGEVVPAEPPH
jgi:hypothetical protein